MAHVVVITGLRPSPRFPPDALLWTRAAIEESAALLAPGVHGTEIDSTLIPAYADPANPPTVDVSTSAATLAAGYYRVVFYDDDEGFQATEWRFDGPSYVPGASELRDMTATNDETSGFDWARFGYGPPAPGQPDRLVGVAARAAAYVQQITGRTLDETLPAELTDLAGEAVLLRAQQLVVGSGSTKAVRDALDSSRISSLRAGDFQVNYRDADRSTAATRPLRVNAWDALNDDLLALMTPEKRAALLAEQSGTVAPAALGVGGPVDGVTAYPVWDTEAVYGWW